MNENQRLAVLHGIRDIRIEERLVPEPGPRQVLVEVAAVGVCGSDVHYYEHGRIADFVVRKPLVLGHEASGTIVAVGEQVRTLTVGQRVALEPGVPCGTCRECRLGRYNLCPDVQFFATPPVDGAFAEYVVIDEAFAHPIPASLSDEAAALVEPLSVAVWAAGKARIEPGTAVLVTGAGPIGLLCVQVARARAASRIVVTDVSDHRLQAAKRMGADDVVNVRERPLSTRDIEANVLLECSGNQAAVESALRCMMPGGTVVLVGMGDVALSIDAFQAKELWVTGTFRYAHAYPASIALAGSGSVHLEGLVTGHFGLDEVTAALEAFRNDPTSLKAIVHPNSRAP
ncbi:NAD(P)-dependent alcohol dehydrogenase [Pendulispora brunnea]|uniref:NAD(P)-dependent alcohol dehydrogenase n=1 Tax=Pendulispora brunnea TaxID=2905690 RepID=A0ABZ2JXT6_9BACT